MKEQEKADMPRKRIKWEDPKLVRLNGSDRVDGAPPIDYVDR